MTDEVISPLRQRMIEDMTIRRLVSKTHALVAAQRYAQLKYSQAAS